MSQHYPPTHKVLIPPDTRFSSSLKKIIERDGLITPILVYLVDEDLFRAADYRQAERVLACSQIGFETVLVETVWTKEDLG